MDLSFSPEVSAPKSAYWGPWATLGLTACVLCFFGVVQWGVAFPIAMWMGGDVGSPEAQGVSESLQNDGFLLAISTLVTSPLGVAGICCLVLLRRGATLGEYLALRRVSFAQLAKWVALVLVFALASDLLTLYLGRPIVPEFMREVYETSRVPLLLWIAIVVGAPVFEEALFRGFAHAGLAQSRVGATGTVLITASTWAAIHLQYDFYGVATIFAVGLLFGWARERTGSLVPCIAMHAAMNLVAAIETAIIR